MNARSDRDWMRHALGLADAAQSVGEIPVGAVVVVEGQVVGEGWNRTIAECDPTAHAEIVALRAAGKALGNYRLPGATLYVTLEPCAMCTGAMIHARIERLVFGATDPKTGAVGGCFNLLSGIPHNHELNVEGGCLEPECGEILRAFFRARRST